MGYARTIILLYLTCLGVSAQPLTPSELAWPDNSTMSCDLVNPPMTSSNAPSGHAYGTYGAFGDAAAPWRAFDDFINYNDPLSAGSVWNAPLTNGVSTASLIYHFPIPKLVSSYTIWETASVKQITAWTFEASNDGSSWTVLDAKTNIAWVVSGGGSGYFQAFNIPNQSTYLYYKINATQSNNANFNDQVEIAELELNGCRK